MSFSYYIVVTLRISPTLFHIIRSNVNLVVATFLFTHSVLKVVPTEAYCIHLKKKKSTLFF